MLSTALRNQEYHILFVLFRAHEGAEHLTKVGQHLLQHLKPLLVLHIRRDERGYLAQKSRNNHILALVIALLTAVLDLLDVDQSCLHRVLLR